MSSVLIPLPQSGFDPTETAIPWGYLKRAGISVTFAVPNKKLPVVADPLMVTGLGLPVLFKKTLMAEPNAVAAYGEMQQSHEFKNPLNYDEIVSSVFHALLLPGGHAKGMRVYLESELLQKTVAEFFAQNKPVGAICHGTLLAGRSRAADGKSVLHGRKTTGLTWGQEMIAWSLTRLTLDDYYRTYPTPMQTELVSYLEAASDYVAGSGSTFLLRLVPGLPKRHESDSLIVPMKRDSENNLNAGFTVTDGNYLSARWPGDAHKFGTEFVQLLRRLR